MSPLKVVWTDNGLDGVKRIYDFLSEKNPGAARKAAGLIRGRVSLLQKHPNMGRPAMDLEPEHRELLIPFGIGGYVVLYHLDMARSLIVVLAVRHQKEVGYG
jgi:toxin ParE1/3/4